MFYRKFIGICIISLMPVTVFASPTLALKSQMYIDGVVVGSVCSVVVESDASRSGIISFGAYHKNRVSSDFSGHKAFQVKLFEDNASDPGCSAFSAGSGLVKFTFGDDSVRQLDDNGVITKGAGDNIRIAISSTDTGVVSDRNKITANNSVLTYPKDFAVKGVFGFMAVAEGLDTAKIGDYHGSLSLVVTYQ